MSVCDVVVPTYNGTEKLKKTIQALREQSVPPSWSVRLVVVDDGSLDGDSEAAVCTIQWDAPWEKPLYKKVRHGGRSYARNIGIDCSGGEVLLFLADDIVLRPGALAEHLLFHERNQGTSAAALGCISWDREIMPTPFMEWMNHGGQQNNYDALLGELFAKPESFFYGSFVSVKKALLGDERFSEEFSQYGWEDLEFGERLGRKGMRLHVLHDAVAHHSHRYTAVELLRRQRIVGAARYRVNTNGSRKVKHALYGILGIRFIFRKILELWGDTLNTPRFFGLVTAGEFWYGVHHANRLLKSKK